MGVSRSKRTGRLARRLTVALVLGVALLVSLAVAGCGGASKRQTVTRTVAAPVATPAGAPPVPLPSGGAPGGSPAGTGTPRGRSESPPLVAIEVSIPALGAERRIPGRYTCDGADESLPLRWSGVPRGTAELAVFLVNLKPVHGRLLFDWAVAGLSPSSRGIAAGAPPVSAVVGRNSFGKVGYSLCPARGESEHYIARVLALPHPLAATRGFDARALYLEAERSAKVVGIGGGVYTRR